MKLPDTDPGWWSYQKVVHSSDYFLSLCLTWVMANVLMSYKEISAYLVWLLYMGFTICFPFSFYLNIVGKVHFAQFLCVIVQFIFTQHNLVTGPSSLEILVLRGVETNFIGDKFLKL